MSEQKYYVMAAGRNHLYFHYETDSGEFSWIDEKECCRENCKIIFTKSELAEIMDGALYRVCNKDETFGLSPHVCDIEGVDCTEWINPLIDLVPVEEEE